MENDTVQAFLDHARSLAEWHEGRSDAFERRAGTLLGFATLTSAAMVALAGPIGAAQESGLRGTVIGAYAAAMALLIFSGFSGLMVLKVRTHLMPTSEKLRSEWTQYEQDRGATTAATLGGFVNDLVVPDAAQGTNATSSIDSLEAAADVRGVWLQRAFWTFLLSMGLLGYIGIGLLILGVIR